VAETTGSTPVAHTAVESTAPVAAQADMNPVVTAEAHEAHAPAGHGGGHGFDFTLLNESHNYPTAAVEWSHGAPQLLLNAPKYALKNFALLEQKPGFATVTVKDGFAQWAQDVSAEPGYAGPPAADLAKAMTIADQSAWLGSMPRALSFFDHQTFWSTIALSLVAIVLLITHRRRIEQHKPEGRVQHILETLVLFVRDEIVRPNFSHSPNRGAAWVPFFGGLLLALLTCNLFGLIPLFATATGGLGTTAAFAAVIALLMLVLGMKQNGVVGFWVSLVPVKWKWHPGTMALWCFLFVSELISLTTRPIILAVRLFANMFAGHITLLVFASLAFIVFAAGGEHPNLAMSSGLGIFGWVMAFALYALELLVALIQAYIFTLLSAVFIGLCMHPEH
jgi:F-type H+-transporting ATPase subunit a